jgi:hypothetical protein
MTLDQEEDLQQKLSSWRSGFSKEKSKGQQQKDKANMLEDAMQRVKESTGINGIDEFIDRFLQFEDANFMWFETHNTLAAGVMCDV